MNIINKIWHSKYVELNNSFNKRLVFRIGVDAGFFSEYNNTILAVLFCLNNKVKFVLSSKENNFSFKQGWQDYFMPFFEEDNSSVHFSSNVRKLSGLSNSIYRKVHSRIYKIFSGTNFYTQDVWPLIRNANFLNDKFNICELGINGNMLEALQIIVKNSWQLQPYLNLIIDEKKNYINLPKDFIGLHIRGGDKIVEHSIYSIDDYIVKVNEISKCKNLFIATDDYSNVLKIRKKYPEYKVYTLCDEKSNGFDEGTYNVFSKEKRKISTLQLLVDIEILVMATFFIGTYSSNVGMYMGIRRGTETCYCLDFDDWRVW